MHSGVDLILVDKIVNEVKSQGVFDQFRKDSMADVDTKPAYQNLRQRVETSVGKFLAEQKWKSDLNKFQVREKLRKYIVEAGFLDTGVERIVDQVVNPKISTVFQPKIEDIAYNYLGIEKPHTSPRMHCLNGSLDIKTDLLPTDLEAVSPDSDKTKSESKEDIFNESNEDKNEEFESPPFEPIESVVVAAPVRKEDSDNSHLSGISGLTSQDSVSSEHKVESPVAKFAVSADTQPESELSEVSSNSRLSIVTNEENSESEKPMVKKPADVDISEEAQMPKFSENSEEANTQHDLHFDIKREDIKFEGTERKVDSNLFSFTHRDAMDIKRESDELPMEIKSESKTDSQFKSEGACAKSQHDSEIKAEEALVDSLSTKHSSTNEEDKRECAAVDMSLSENESSRGSNSTGSRSRNKKSLDMHSNGSRSGSFRPRPPSPPNDCMLQKPPSPNYYMLPVPPPPPTPPPPPPPGDDLYMHPPLPPVEPQMSSKPPSPPRIPPLPPTPPPPPGEEPPLPGIPPQKQCSPNIQPPSPSPPPLPPKEESPPTSRQYSSPERMYQHSSSAFTSFSSKGPTMPRTPPTSPPPAADAKEFDYPSPEQKNVSVPYHSTPLSPSLRQKTGSPKYFRYEKESESTRTKYEMDGTSRRSELQRPPSPKYRPPSPPSPPKHKAYSPQQSQRYDYRPPSPKQQPSASPNHLSHVEDVSSPMNEDYANSPSPPPYEELRPNSPTSFDLKSISSKETSFSLSETSQNETISKPTSPLSPKEKGSSSKDPELTKQSTPPENKSKSEQSLKPPSTPPQSKSSSKSESRNSKSSSHHSHHHKSSKSSRDDKSSSKSHSHRSSSSSSRNHTSSSSHRSDEKKRPSSSSSSSKHKSSKSDSRDKERDKDKNRKKDDHSSARHKERRRKSTDSNDGDSHKHGSKHGGSRHGHEKSTHSTTKESTSNSNSSGNFSSTSNSCNDSAQRHCSGISRSYKSKESHRSSGRQEDLKFFVISDEEGRNTDALLSKLSATIQTNSPPAYLLDCDQSMQEAVKYLTKKVVNIQDEKSINEVPKYTVTYLSSDLSASKPDQTHFQDKIMKTVNGKKPIVNNVAHKRKADGAYRTSYKMLTPANDKLRNETCLIIDCIEYDKPHKMSCLSEERINVSPTSSDMSVSSKENEFIDTKMKNLSSQNMKNGKMIKAEGIVRIEKSNNNNGFKIKNQRYSSDDLYKPRPLLSQRPRRRELLGDADPA